MAALRVGDPAAADTDLGPLATAAIRDQLATQVDQSVAAGARLLTGGQRLERPGYFYAPTVLADIPRAAPAYAEELFGPVASLFRAKDLDDAIRLANDTAFGLGASAWTRDRARSGSLRRRARRRDGLHQWAGDLRRPLPLRRRSRAPATVASSAFSACANSST